MELRDVWHPGYHTIRLLIAEKGPQYAAFVVKMDGIPDELTAEAVREFFEAAEKILRSERTALEAPGRWRARLRNGLGLIRWSRFAAWSRRDPPRFP